jgi:hypothetical protein
MKRAILMVAVFAFFSYVFVCNAAAEDWVLYSKGGDASLFYDANMSYVRDDIGETPYIQVRIKVVRGGKIVQNRVFKVDPEVTMLQPLQKSQNIMDAAFDDWASFEASDFRLVDGIKRWKQIHKK